MTNLVIWTFWVWSAFIFTSFSVSALGHILILPPCLYFAYANFKEKKYKLSYSQLTLIALIIIIFVSMLVNFEDYEKPLKMFLKSKYYFFGCFGTIALNYMIKLDIKKLKLKSMLNLFMVSTIIASVSGIIALYTQYHPLRMKAACHADRACGMYGMYITYGYQAAFALILLIGMFVYRKKLNNYLNEKLLIVAIIFNFAGLYLSYTRGALLGVVIAFPFLYRKNFKKLFISIGVLACLTGMFYIYSPKLKDMFQSAERMRSVSVRLSQWKAALFVFERHPLIGVGFKNFEQMSAKIKKENNLGSPNFGGHAHSNFLEHLATMGILGFLITIAFHIFWGIELFKRNDILGDLIFPFFILFSISGLTQYTFGDGENLFFIMLIYMISQVKLPRSELNN